jgi:hypothetical protein
MAYFNYHKTAKKLIENGKLCDFYFIKTHNKISPALVLIFNDEKHHVMPLREYRWKEYYPLIRDFCLNIEE